MQATSLHNDYAIVGPGPAVEAATAPGGPAIAPPIVVVKTPPTTATTPPTTNSVPMSLPLPLPLLLVQPLQPLAQLPLLIL